MSRNGLLYLRMFITLSASSPNGLLASSGTEMLPERTSVGVFRAIPKPFDQQPDEQLNNHRYKGDY